MVIGNVCCCYHYYLKFWYDIAGKSSYPVVVPKPIDIENPAENSNQYAKPVGVHSMSLVSTSLQKLVYLFI